mgnify:FL=1
MSIEESVTLPTGWRDRTVQVSHPERTEGNVGHCIEAHDLAASKLAAYREKDRVFVSTLLRERLIDGRILLCRVNELPVDGEQKKRLVNWIRITAEDLGVAVD